MVSEAGVGLNILLAVKQVPDVSELRLDPVTHSLLREGVPSVLNPYDRYALEAGLRLKEIHGGRLTVVSMGPPQARKALQESLALGADEAVLLTDRAFAAADTWATAYTLSVFAKTIPFNMVLTGLKAIDGETSQVGAELAEFLDIPHASYVRKIDLRGDMQGVTIERQLENGYDVWELPLPCLLMVAKEFGQPRLATLQGYIRAKRQKIRILTAHDLEALGANSAYFGLKGSPTFIPKVSPPPAKPPGTIWSGDPKESVRKLVDALSREGFV